MLKDRKDFDQEDDDVDLTGMINEYSQDNELRKKIDELKRQKEEEKRMAQPQTSVLDQLAAMSDEDSYSSSALNTSPKKGGIPDIRVDDDFEKTRVGFNNDSAYDKTLVIMDHKTGASGYAEEENQEEEDVKSLTSVFDMHHAQNFDDVEVDEDDEEEYEEEDDDDNLLSRIKARREEKAREKSSQEYEDEEEDDGDQDHGKMNKIITYVIIGIVGICIIVGAFFGVKYMLKNFLGGSSTDPKTVDKNKEDNTETNTTKPTDTNKEDENTKPKEDITDNSTIIRQLEKQLETYEKQLGEVNQEIGEEQTKYDNAQTTLDGLKDILNDASDYQNQAQEVLKLQNELRTAEGNYNAEQDPTKKAILKQTMDTAQNAYDTAVATYGSYDDLVQKSNEKNDEYNTKSKDAATEKAAAEKRLKELNEKKQTLENNIAQTTTKLGKYE